ncbi:HD domain-containing protein [Cellulosilyticum sp. WCF-2]|uniref:HD domain-containing protein n=1 Tax=Cellulosilyticum sp. WCF-2 TaxID=2497860 RepID=UPI000F8E1642|nr:HD domain-containing protein [Cellulosilyticum sp. WCF-2]QEH70693.1 HD domain-containing protein [Cellulosilyticum sp. WCF-2]
MINKLAYKMMTYYSGDAKRIQHFTKVHSFAKLIGEMEQLDQETLTLIEVTALVHDIGIKEAEAQFGSSNGKLQEQLGPDLAKKILKELGYHEEKIERVCYVVGHHHTYTDIQRIDYQILVEADFLVNFYEDQLGKEAIKTAYNNIFKTPSGKKLCEIMYGI